MPTAPTDTATETEAKRKTMPTMVTVKLLYRTLHLNMTFSWLTLIYPKKIGPKF